jgi:hypothetical protein
MQVVPFSAYSLKNDFTKISIKTEKEQIRHQ